MSLRIYSIYNAYYAQVICTAILMALDCLFVVSQKVRPSLIESSDIVFRANVALQKMAMEKVLNVSMMVLSWSVCSMCWMFLRIYYADEFGLGMPTTNSFRYSHVYQPHCTLMTHTKLLLLFSLCRCAIHSAVLHASTTGTYTRKKKAQASIVQIDSTNVTLYWIILTAQWHVSIGNLKRHHHVDGNVFCTPINTTKIGVRVQTTFSRPHVNCWHMTLPLPF